jgi:VWFA-related protein
VRVDCDEPVLVKRVGAMGGLQSDPPIIGITVLDHLPRRIAGIAVAIALVAGVVVAQQSQQETPIAAAPPVTFRAEINFVEVDAFVTDADGNPVTDLTAADFEIFEDDEPQTIEVFTHVDIPIERAARPSFATEAIEPDVQSNASVEGRVYLFVLDSYHIDALRAERVRSSLTDFVQQRMGINDVAAIVYLGGRPEDGQDFTNNTRLLTESVERFAGRKLTSATAAMTREFNRPAVQALLENGSADFVQDPLEFERSWRARQSMEAVSQLADFMGGVRGRRKTMVFFSEGIIFNVYDPFSATASAVLDESRDAIASATRANVSIYAIDPRGLGAPEDLVLAANSPAADSDRISADSPTLNLGLRSLNAEFRLSQESLRVLAERTGGFAAVNRNRLDEVFDRIVRENSSYYVLGFYSTNARRSGRYRSLDVRVRRPGLEIRARDGYVEARGRAREVDVVPGETPAAAAVRGALASPLAVTGLPLQVFAAAYKGVAPNAMVPVVIELDASSLNFNEMDGIFNARLYVTLMVADGEGERIAANQHTVNLALQATTLAVAREHGVRVVSELSLPPGSHRLRVVVADEAGRVGSVSYDLDVPEFSEEPFSMSGVTLTAASAGEMVTARAQDSLGQLLPGPPIATREFRSGDVLTFFAEVYENAQGVPEHALDLTTILRAEDGRVVFRSEEERSSAELESGRGGYGYAAQVPLDVEPGLYVLRVEGRSRLSGTLAGEGRDILIRVTP